jgi:hypothetical protein
MSTALGEVGLVEPGSDKVGLQGSQRLRRQALLHQGTKLENTTTKQDQRAVRERRPTTMEVTMNDDAG